jgi:para-nitrobenzyl esterase
MDVRTVAEGLRGAGMIVDGWVVPEDASHVFANARQLPVDVLVGSNSDEGSFMPAGPSASEWRQQLQLRWGTAASVMEKFYPADDDAEAMASSRAAFSDGASWHMRLFAAYQASLGAQAWVYEFDHDPPVDAGERDLDAVHSAELPYVFGNLAAKRLYPDSSSPQRASESVADQILAERMATWWVNFARTGNPNGSGQPAWPAYRNMNGRAMMLNAEPSAETGVETAKWLRYNQLFQQMLQQ